MRHCSVKELFRLPTLGQKGSFKQNFVSFKRNPQDFWCQFLIVDEKDPPSHSWLEDTKQWTMTGNRAPKEAKKILNAAVKCVFYRLWGIILFQRYYKIRNWIKYIATGTCWKICLKINEHLFKKKCVLIAFCPLLLISYNFQLQHLRLLAANSPYYECI